MSITDTKPKAFSYLRFSTSEQAKGDSQRRQWDLAQRYADEQGLELDTEITFKDLGVSAFRGANAETGRLGDFLRAVDGGLVPPGSFLLVESLDRISRSTARKALRVLEDIIERGVTVVTLADRRKYDSQNIDSDPTSLIMSILVFMRAHEESAIKSSRLKAVYESKRKAAKDTGKKFTKRLPAWMRFDEETQSIELIPEREKIVREIFEWAEAGFGKQAIAGRLNERGEKTWGKAKFWHRSYVQKILTNPAAAGTFVPKTRDIVDGKLLRKTQEPIYQYFPSIVEQVKEIKGQPQARTNSNLFSGLGKCALCGAAFIRVSKGKYTYLVCSTAHAKGGCEYLSVPYEIAEKAITENIAAIVAEVPRGKDTKELEMLILQTEEELSDKASDLEFLLEDYARTRSPVIRERISKLEAELETLQERIGGFSKQREQMASGIVLKRIEKLSEAFSGDWDTGRANRALRENIKTLEFHPKHGLLSIQWHDGTWAVDSIPLHLRRLRFLSD